MMEFFIFTFHKTVHKFFCWNQGTTAFIAYAKTNATHSLEILT